MDLLFSYFKRWLAPGMVAAAVLGSTTAFAEDRQLEKIETPQKGSTGSTSNLNRLDSGDSKSLRDAVSKPSNFFKQRIEDEGAPLNVFRPPRAPQLSKREREIIEQRKNWAFTDWKDLSHEQSMEEMLGVKQYGPDGKETKSLSPIDKFYESFDKPGAQDSISESILAARFKDPFSTNIMTGTGLSVTEEDRFLHRISGRDFVNPADKPENDGGVAVYGSAAYLQKRTEERQKEHQKALQEMLNPHYTTETAGQNTYNLPNDPLHQGQPGNGGLGAAAVERTSVLNPLLGVATAPRPYHSHLLDDPTARALGMPDPSLLPKVEPAPKAPPVSAFPAALPKRSFP
jgi:hypothetical protein